MSMFLLGMVAGAIVVILIQVIIRFGGEILDALFGGW